MTPKFRAAIFAGVSTDRQARENKDSIPDQIKTAREYILEEGGDCRHNHTLHLEHQGASISDYSSIRWRYMSRRKYRNHGLRMLKNFRSILRTDGRGSL